MAIPCRLLRAMLGYAMRGCAVSAPGYSGLRQSVSMHVTGNRGVASPCHSYSLHFSAFHFRLTARPVRAIQFLSKSGHVFSSPLRFSVVLYFAFSFSLTAVLIVAFPLRFRALFRFASPFRFPSMLGFAIANELRAMRLHSGSLLCHAPPCQFNSTQYNTMLLHVRSELCAAAGRVATAIPFDAQLCRFPAFLAARGMSTPFRIGTAHF